MSCELDVGKRNRSKGFIPFADRLSMRTHPNDYTNEQLRALIFLFGYYGGFEGKSTPVDESIKGIHLDFEKPFETPIGVSIADYCRDLLKGTMSANSLNLGALEETKS